MYLQKNGRCFRSVMEYISHHVHCQLVYEMMVSTFAWALAFTMVTAYYSDLDALSETYPSCGYCGYCEPFKRINIVQTFYVCKYYKFSLSLTSNG